MQITYYVSHLSNEQPDLYYWGLLTIYNDSEYGRKLIDEKYANTNNNYLYSLTHFQKDAERFRYLYKKYHNSDYLILACYLSGNSKALSQLSKLNDHYRRTVINILVHKKSEPIPSHPLSILDAYLNSNLYNYSSNGVNIISNSDSFTNAVIKALFLQYQYSKNNFDKVIKVYSSTDLKYFPLSNIRVKTYKSISVAYYMKGYYYDSIHLSKDKLIPLAEFINNKDLLEKSYSNYGTFLYLIGDIAQAQKYYAKAYNLAKKNSNYSNFGVIISNLALTYSKMGDLNKAISYQYEAYRHALTKQDHQNISVIIKNLAFYYMNIDNWNDALTYLKKSYKYSLESGEINNILWSQIALSHYYWQHLKNFTKADSLIQTELKEAQNSDNYKFSIIALTDKYTLLRDFHKIKQTIPILDTILSMSHAKKDWKVWTANEVGKSYLLTKLGKFSKADSILTHLSPKKLSLLEFTDKVDKTIAEARILRHRHKDDDAIQKLQDLKTRIFRRVRNSVDRQSGHLMLTDDELESIHLLDDLYLQKDEYDKAIALQDQVKTLNKAAYLNSSVLKSSLFNDRQLIRDRLLTKNIEKYRSQLADADSSQSVSIQNKLADAIAQKNELENQIVSSLNEKQVTVGDIQDRLSDQDAVLYYTQFKNEIYASLITNDQVRIHKIPLPDSLKSVFVDAAHSLQGKHANLTGLHHVYHVLFDSVNISPYKRLYVVPDGILYQIPLGILPATTPANKYSYGSTHYMIENHSISYYTSLQELYHSWKPSAASDKFKLEYAGFGIDKFSNRYSSLASNKVLGALPNTVKEVESIDSLLPGNQKDKRVFINKEATEKTFKKVAPEARILHLATHSEVFYDEPLFSVIYMDKNIIRNASYTENNGNDSDPQDDGQIHAYELFPLHLRSAMVMLSSCESGTGSYITGSGLIGLNRAFTYAGVKSLVMNMWKVDDKAAETVSVQFYKYLKQGLPKDEALRRAKLYYLNNIDADPLKWGSYIVTGKVAPLFHPIWSISTIATRLLLLLIAVIAGYTAYRFNQ